MSTQFQHKTIHKGTWISPDLTTVNEIDHILLHIYILKKTVQDVRTLRGPNSDSDHFLVKTITKQLIITPIRNTENRKHWNLDNIRNPVKLKQYSQMIYEKLVQKMEQKEVNHEWKNIKNTILV